MRSTRSKSPCCPAGRGGRPERTQAEARPGGVAARALPAAVGLPGLARRDHAFFPGNTEVLLREVFEHVLRMLDDLDAERDRASSALEASLAINSNRLNKTMKRLAVITVAVAVVGSVFGAYGMNFEVLPLAMAQWGFWVVGLGTIAMVASGLLGLGW